MGQRGVERAVERAQLGVGLAVGARQGAALGEGQERGRVLDGLRRLRQAGQEKSGNNLNKCNMKCSGKGAHDSNRDYQLDSLVVLASGPGAHRPRRLDERVGAAQQEAVAGGAGAAPLEGGLQRGRRSPVHRDHRHEPPVPHTGE